MDVTIQQIVQHNAQIRSFELVHPEGQALPAFAAGSHIDVELACGLTRQYSLSNCSSEQHRYVIGVLNDPSSRGGSRYMHEQLAVGQALKISAPRNLFALVPTGEYAILCAGGIGITPILAMAKELQRQDKAFKLIYFVKTRSALAFQEDLTLLGADVHLHIDDEPETHVQLSAEFAQINAAHHVYVCGPTGFMDYVIGTAEKAGWAAQNIHKEHFAAPSIDASNDGSFNIKILKTGQLIPVAADESAAEALEKAGLPVTLSCEQGICGTCLINVVAGEVDHRDVYLTEEEQAAHNQFTPCCSRAKSQTLVIDL